MCDDESHYTLIQLILSFQRHGLVGLAFLALLVNSAFVIFVIRGCRSEEMPTKRFLFVLNRSLADVATAVVTLVYLGISLSTPCVGDPHLGCTTKDSLLHPLPLQMSISLDFWNVAASYTGVALLTVYAVRNPIVYKTRLTIRQVYGSILISWILLLVSLAVIYAFMRGFSESFDSNGMIYIMLHGYYGETSYWHSDLCTNLSRQQPLLLAVISLAIPSFLILLTTCSYILVARALCNRQSTRNLGGANALMRLGMHLGLFAITVGLMATTYFTSIPLSKYCRESSKNRDVDNCGYKPFWRYSALSAISSWGWFVRMALDPIIDVAFDSTLRRLLFRRKRHRLSTYTLSTENHRLSMTARGSTPGAATESFRLRGWEAAESVLAVTRM